MFDAVTGDFLGFGLAGEVRFNTQPAIEAADTGPFFHNNGVQTIEEAVGFYVSPAFKDSQAGHLVPIVLDSSEIEAIAAFLRVTNALENIRSSSEMDQAAIDESDRDTSQRLADLASDDTEDGFQVLDQRFLHPDSVAKLKLAFVKEQLAAHANIRAVRNALLQGALALKADAKDDMVVGTY